jgi:hypothetical protein
MTISLTTVAGSENSFKQSQLRTRKKKTQVKNMQRRMMTKIMMKRRKMKLIKRMEDQPPQELSPQLAALHQNLTRKRPVGIIMHLLGNLSPFIWSIL